MGHERQNSHVPKFGNWDNDNVPYTIYFENALKEKAIINPNDPEAFNLYMKGVKDNDNDIDDAMKVCAHPRSYSTSSIEKISHTEEGENNITRHRTWGSFTAESASERSNSDYSVIQRVKSNHRKSMSVGDSFIGSFFSSHLKRRGGSLSSNDNANHGGTVLIPEFGAWDVTDPKSGEGYTAIFNEIREEKKIASRRIPGKAPSLNNSSNVQNQCGRPSSILSKEALSMLKPEVSFFLEHWTLNLESLSNSRLVVPFIFFVP